MDACRAGSWSARPLHADAAAVAPRGAGVQVAALEHDHVGDAAPRELVGEREAHDAAADDDDLGARGELGRGPRRPAPISLPGRKRAGERDGARAAAPRVDRCERRQGDHLGRRADGEGRHLRGRGAETEELARDEREAALALAGPGTEPGVALDRLEVAVARCEGTPHLRERHVLAGADERLTGRHGPPPPRAARWWRPRPRSCGPSPRPRRGARARPSVLRDPRARATHRSPHGARRRRRLGAPARRRGRGLRRRRPCRTPGARHPRPTPPGPVAHHVPPSARLHGAPPPRPPPGARLPLPPPLRSPGSAAHAPGTSPSSASARRSPRAAKTPGRSLRSKQGGEAEVPLATTRRRARTSRRRAGAASMRSATTGLPPSCQTPSAVSPQATSPPALATARATSAAHASGGSPGTRRAHRNLPPGRVSPSARSTLAPRVASASAAPRPAGPAPTTRASNRSSGTGAGSGGAPAAKVPEPASRREKATAARLARSLQVMRWWWSRPPA